jgi:multiple sugar transport system permease protein
MDRNAQQRLRRRIGKVLYLIGLFLAMLIICLPGFWIVLSSLRPPVEIMAKPPVWIPNELSLDAYRAMFSGIGKGGIPIWDYFRNSLIISSPRLSSRS